MSIMPPGSDRKASHSPDCSISFPLRVRDLAPEDLGRMFFTPGHRGVLQNFWFDGPESGKWGVVTTTGISFYPADQPCRLWDAA